MSKESTNYPGAISVERAEELVDAFKQERPKIAQALTPCLADIPFERDGKVAGYDVCRLPRGHEGEHRTALLPRATEPGKP